MLLTATPAFSPRAPAGARHPAIRTVLTITPSGETRTSVFVIFVMAVTVSPVVR